MEKIIEIKNLNKIYTKTKALDNLDFNLYDGDTYGLVGANGAGKSTLLKILAGYIEKNSGDVNVFDKNLDKNTEIRNSFGFLIEEASFYSYFTGMQNLKYLADLKGIEIPKETFEIAKLFKIDNALNKKVKAYSTGMKQRLGIVAALMNRPRVLILDEPINGLDPEGIVDLRNVLLRINKEWNTTIVVSSHILNELSLIANRIGFIKKGKMLQELTREELDSKVKDYIKIVGENENLNKIVNILEEDLKIENFKVMDNNEIRVFDKIDILTIQKEMAKHNIYLNEIYHKKSTLEEYYVKLMGGQDE
ncbi:ABC transporter ATP-binding protein [Peptoniphilus sp.]|jgi:ABC-type multidrug transport system ATPase subunit|uniref:ABC transporter ATP-binding protein n=1 Tax=Peptoniphilus sp. TaxID=1971214 RepID=UPI003D8C660F